jgi:hypothetical protein
MRQGLHGNALKKQNPKIQQILSQFHLLPIITACLKIYLNVILDCNHKIPRYATPHTDLSRPNTFLTTLLSKHMRSVFFTQRWRQYNIQPHTTNGEIFTHNLAYQFQKRGNWRKLHNELFYKLYSLSNIVTVLKVEMGTTCSKHRANEIYIKIS